MITRRDLLLHIEAPVKVMPLSRPRWNPLSSRMWQPLKEQGELRRFLAHYQGQLSGPIEYPVVVDSLCLYRPGPKRRMFHSVKPDEDNLRKAVLDGLVAAEILKDDCYVVGGEHFKHYGPEDSLTVRIFIPGLETKGG